MFRNAEQAFPLLIVPLIDRSLIVAPLNPPASMFDRSLQQQIIQFVKILHFRNRHQKVSSREAYQPFDSSLLLAFGGVAKARLKRVVAPKSRKALLLDPPLPMQNLPHSDRQIVIHQNRKYAAIEEKRSHVRVEE